jgi:DNA adenine methylase
VEVRSVDPLRLRYFTPLRYPGGKAKLTPYIKRILIANDLVDGEYAEPYAGGAAVALELMLQEFVTRIHINDISRHVYAFWWSVLNETDKLASLVASRRLTISEWDRQKRIASNPSDYDELELGFATFFLNRTNRSGILSGGIIGGRDQDGPWKIDARFNRNALIHRIESIANLKSRIELTRWDAAKFIAKRVKQLPKKSLTYLDPPYYIKGKDLYYDYYSHGDHEAISKLVLSITHQKWIVSYDDVVAIRELYSNVRSKKYDVAYSARDNYAGREVMFFCPALEIP